MKQKILLLSILLLFVTSNPILGQTQELPDNIVDADCYVTPPAFEWKIKEATTASASIYNPHQPVFVGDVNGDGKPEIVVTNNLITSTAVYILDNNANELSKFSIPDTYSGANPIGAIGKVKMDNSGNHKVLFFTVDGLDKILRAYDISGTQVWQSSTAYTTTANMPAAMNLVDLDGDGWCEFVVGTLVYAAENGVQLFSFSESTAVNIGWGTYLPTSSGSLLQSSTGDVLNNGKQQVCAGNVIYDVTIANRNTGAGNTYTKKTITPVMFDASFIPDPTNGNTQLADFDLDGNVDIVVSTIERSTLICYVYIWSPSKNEILASAKLPNVYKKSVAFVGDIDGNGYPEIVFMHGKLPSNAIDHSTDKITALKYDASSATKELSIFWQIDHDDTSGATAITLFDFNQDGIAELVYRDELNLRVINGSLKHHITGASTTVYDLVSYPCLSATGFEYPIVADIDNDGQAEIIVVGSNTGGVQQYGPVRIFKAGDGTSWAPARRVWNQYVYNSLNINEDLTIPQYPISPATVFPGSGSGVVRPFNNFLQQQTMLNKDGTPLWLAPNGQIVGTPTFVYNDTNDEMTITVQVKNVGNAIFQKPFYATVYRDNIGGSPSETIEYENIIEIDETIILTFTLTNFQTVWSPYNFLVIKINAKADGVTNQRVCDEDNTLYYYYGLLPTQQEVCKDNIGEMKCTFTHYPYYTYQWQYSINNITWVDITGATTRNYTPSYLEPGIGYFRVKVSDSSAAETVHHHTESVKVTSRRCVMPVNPNIHIYK